MTEKGEDLESALIECEPLLGLESTGEYDDPDDSRGTLIVIIALLSYCLYGPLYKRYNKY
jgi:hypothetical protein